MKRLTTTVLAALAGACTVFACNLKDPVPPLSEPDCVGPVDCSDHGGCNEEGVCDCDEGYEGTYCGACADGYRRMDDACVSAGTNGATNNPPNQATNNTSPCEPGQIMLDDECVDDLCADGPCGIGECTQDDASSYSCSCPDGSTGQSCPDCDADSCVNGTCNEDTGLCECDDQFAGPVCDECAPGWAGDACDQCAQGAFGPECTTCEEFYDMQEWWNTDYLARAAIVIFNPDAGANVAVQPGIHVPLTLDHSALVSSGALENGDDLRLVSSTDTELDRILAPNSQWNQSDTTIFIQNQSVIPPGDFDVVYAYYGSDTAADPPADPTAVLSQAHGWGYDNNDPDAHLYSSGPLIGANYTVQFRQLTPGEFEFHVRDASDLDVGTELQIRDSTGDVVEERNVLGSGDSDTPLEFNETLTIDLATFGVFLNTENTGPVTHWYGSTLYTGNGNLSQIRTFSRQFSDSARPMIRACDPQPQQ